MIADTFGRQRASEQKDSYVIDYTRDNWNCLGKCVWALTMNEWTIRDKNGDATKNEKPKPYSQWLLDVGRVSVRDLSFAVLSEMLDGFFHNGAADSE